MVKITYRLPDDSILKLKYSAVSGTPSIFHNHVEVKNVFPKRTWVASLTSCSESTLVFICDLPDDILPGSTLQVWLYEGEPRRKAALYVNGTCVHKDGFPSKITDGLGSDLTKHYCYVFFLVLFCIFWVILACFFLPVIFIPILCLVLCLSHADSKKETYVVSLPA